MLLKKNALKKSDLINQNINKPIKPQDETM